MPRLCSRCARRAGSDDGTAATVHRTARRWPGATTAGGARSRSGGRGSSRRARVSDARERVGGSRAAPDVRSGPGPEWATVAPGGIHGRDGVRGNGGRPGGRRPTPRLQRLAGGRPATGQRVRRRYRRPPVDPRRRRAGDARESFRRAHRPRVPDALVGQLLPAPDPGGAGDLARRQLRPRQGPIPGSGAGGQPAPGRRRTDGGDGHRRGRGGHRARGGRAGRARTDRCAWPRPSAAFWTECPPAGPTHGEGLSPPSDGAPARAGPGGAAR